MKNKAKILKFLSALLSMVIAASLFIIPISAVDKETPLKELAKLPEIKEENPYFTEYNIDSDAEADYSITPYKISSKFYDGKRVNSGRNVVTNPKGKTRTLESNEYAMQTNAAVLWYARDDVSFMYRKYPISQDKNDSITFSATIDVDSISGKGGANVTGAASVGLLLRSTLDENSSFFWLNVRSKNEVHVIYRTENGAMAIEKKLWKECKSGKVKLSIKKEATKVYFGYQRIGTDREMVWSNSPIVIKAADATAPWYCGVGAHSSDPNNPIYFEFSDFTAEGTAGRSGAAWNDDEGNLNGHGGSSVDPDDPDNPDGGDGNWRQDPDTSNITADTLLMETFTDKDLFNKPTTATNPMWDISLADQAKFETVDKNIAWLNSYETEPGYIGNSDWTDYTASWDFKYKAGNTPNFDSAQYSNTVSFFARHKMIPMYGHLSAFVSIRPYSIPKKDGNNPVYDENGDVVIASCATRISLKFEQNNKTQNLGDLGWEAAVQTIPNVDISQDDTWHNIQLRCFDNVFTVYLDGQEIIKYKYETDGTQRKSVPTGNIGVAVGDGEVYFDNIIVTKLEDPFGGDYDNMLQGSYDRTTPKYIQEWQAKGLPVY